MVTGAGRGIGRAYALLLAARGAAVVVNDLGGSMEGSGADAAPAEEVAREIRAAGGSAHPETSDVATVAGAQAVVDAAREQFGRIDVADQQRGDHPMGAVPRRRRGELRGAPGVSIP